MAASLAERRAEIEEKLVARQFVDWVVLVPIAPLLIHGCGEEALAMLIR